MFKLHMPNFRKPLKKKQEKGIETAKQKTENTKNFSKKVSGKLKNQKGPNKSIEIKKRNPLLVLLFIVITLGIYGIY